MSSIKIVQADASHANIIREIAEKTWWPTYQEILSAEQIRYMLNVLYAEDTIRQQLTNGSQTYLLLLEKEQAVGFVSFAPREEDPAVYKLHKIYCLPETHGRGYGKRLVKAVEKEVIASGKHVLELNVNRYNKAKSFYEAMGFQVAREEDIPIGPYWMNDYLMRKEL